MSSTETPASETPLAAEMAGVKIINKAPIRSVHRRPPFLFVLYFASVLSFSALQIAPVTATTSILQTNGYYLLSTRGGSTTKRTSSSEDDPFRLVAKAIQDRLAEDVSSSSSSSSSAQVPPTLTDITDALEMLATSQQTFKGLDGAAHEAYQRTHQDQDTDDLLTVTGRARRSAARAAATADGLGACELVDLLELDGDDDDDDEVAIQATLAHGNRRVLLNQTTSKILLHGKPLVSVIVLYEPIYHGGAGILHGGITEEEESSNRKRKTPKGRLIVIVGDQLNTDLTRTLQILDAPPKHIHLQSGLLTNEVASVQASLYKAAGALLETIEPTLRLYENSTSAIHFVGRSLAGGIANLAALILDGSLPMPKQKKKKTAATTIIQQEEDQEEHGGEVNAKTNHNDNDNNTTMIAPLSGLGKDRTSSVSLGAPPCVSANVPSEMILSILYGDDIVCRTTKASLDRLVQRSKRALNSKTWLGGRQLNFMTDALSLTVSSLKSHAHGSQGEELRLATPGRAFLLRPRRYGGFCSIHEVGNRLKGGREALRAQVLWQLDDIVLSKSLWKHHQLESYIHGLDRAHLRGIVDGEEDAV